MVRCSFPAKSRAPISPSSPLAPGGRGRLFVFDHANSVGQQVVPTPIGIDCDTRPSRAAGIAHRKMARPGGQFVAQRLWVHASRRFLRSHHLQRSRPLSLLEGHLICLNSSDRDSLAIRIALESPDPSAPKRGARRVQMREQHDWPSGVTGPTLPVG
jgi:hypothetical protein